MDRSTLLALGGALALVLPLAGCFGGGDDAAEDPRQETLEGAAATTPNAGEAAAPGASADGSFDAPTWAVGDAWAVAPEGGEGEPAVLVVTKAEGDAYTLSTTDPDAAGYDALFDVSYLGRIRASDLAGHQGGKPVQFFSFPLTDGKTWTTTWDGLEVKLTATWVPALQTGAGVHPGFAIVGTAEGETYVKYDYVPALKWWSHLTFASGYGMKVQRTFAGWTGDYLVGEAKRLVDGPAEPSRTFVVEEGQAFVHVNLRGSSTQHARAWAILDPEGAPHETQESTAAAGGGGISVTERLPPTPGEWRVVSPVVHADGDFTLVVTQVKLTPMTLA